MDYQKLDRDQLDSYVKKNKIFSPEINPVFMPAWEAFTNNTHTNFQLYGGRGSSKSYFMRKLLEYLFRGYTGHNCRILLLRTTKESAKKSLFRGVLDIITKDIGQRYDQIHQADMSRGILTIKSRDLKNKSARPLFHGVYLDSFSNDEATKEKLKGYPDISHVFIEELKELPSSEMYKQLLTSVMRPYTDKQTGVYVVPKVVAAYNTPHLTHWLVDEYYDVVRSKHEGYSLLKPKSGKIPGRKDKLRFEDLGLHFTFSTIYDNLFFKKSVIDNAGETAWNSLLYEQYEKTEVYDPYHYYTETLGLVGNGRSGQIFKDWKEVSVEAYESIEPDKDLFYGVDFGFSQDVTTVSEIKFVAKKEGELRDKLYIRPLVYETGLLASALSARIKSEIPGFGYSEFFCDQRPEAIAELQQYGIQNAIKAKKGKDSRTPQVSFLLNYEVYYVDYITIDKHGKEQKAIGLEKSKYHWMQNKKTQTYEPSDGDDHFIDSVRYAVCTKLQPDSEKAKWEVYFNQMMDQPMLIL